MGTYILIGLLVGFIFVFFIKSSGEKGYNSMSIDDLSNLINDKNTVLIDVRTRKETSRGMIGKPLEIVLGAGMKEKFSTLDKDKKYVLYCRSGMRSASASGIMTKMGFKDVNNLSGGFLAYQASK